MKKIIWLASYPKSGNTWMRIFLNNYTSTSDEEVDINKLDHIDMSHASARRTFDRMFGFPTSLLSHQELRAHQSSLYKIMCPLIEDYTYVKNHDAFSSSVFPEEATHSAIHIVRNPLEVVVSYANHNNCTIDHAINALSKDIGLGASVNRPTKQIYQSLMSWSDHTKSWMESEGFPTLLIRYEDLKLSPVENFKKVIEFLPLEYDHNKLLKAIENSSFDKLKSQEDKNSFQEKPKGAKSFFRKGEIDSWRSTLSEEQKDRIIKDHKEMMDKLGYSQNS